MLILAEDKPIPGLSKAGEVEAERASMPQAPSDPPPSYAADPAPGPPTPGPSTSAPQTVPVPKTKPTNYAYVNRKNDRLKETFTIDPFLKIPRTFLPPLENGQTEEDRENLRLQAGNGSVDVDVTLLGPSEPLRDDSKLKKRTTLAVNARNGSLQYKLRKFGSEATPHPPFLLKVNAHNGSVHVKLPPNFTGAITIYAKNGSVKLSDTLSQRVSIHNEQNSTRKYFIGSLDVLSECEDPSQWKGDEVDIHADNGRVRVGVVDEIDPEAAGKGGFLSRLFGKSPSTPSSDSGSVRSA